MTTAQQSLIPAQEKARLKRDFRKHLKGDVGLRLFHAASVAHRHSGS